MSLSVRDRYVWEAMQDESYLAKTFGKPIFVLPGASAIHFAYVKNRHAKVTINFADAITEASASRGDVIVFAPGAHTISTASAALSKAGIKLFGPEAWLGQRTKRPSASLTTDIAADQILNITAADVGIYGLKFIPITQSAAVDFSAAAHGLSLQDIVLDMETPAVHANTRGIVALGAAEDVKINGLYARCDGASGAALTLTGCVDFEVANLHLVATAGTWVLAVLCGAGTTGEFKPILSFAGIGAGALSAGIDGGAVADQTSGIRIEGIRANDRVTVPVDNFSAGFAVLNNDNYKGSPGGGSGGALITAIT